MVDILQTIVLLILCLLQWSDWYQRKYGEE